MTFGQYIIYSLGWIFFVFLFLTLSMALLEGLGKKKGEFAKYKRAWKRFLQRVKWAGERP